ncbi:MAG: hypothetical protein ACK5M7_21505 [Draconibacterium sp.]
MELYVQLESLRFREDFGFRITTGSEIEIHKILIPPLILQPYVENAIRHGLAPKKGEKSLLLKIEIAKNQIIISIKDNGVGRVYSRKNNSQKETQHKSLAMELTRSRIYLMGDNSAENERVEIIDLYNEDKPAGTEVVVRLPLKIK